MSTISTPTLSTPQPPQPPAQPITATPRSLTILERMASACSGAILTSLILTPLDVVRVRLQQQEILNPQSSECCKRQVFWDIPVSKISNKSTTTVPIISCEQACSTGNTANSSSTISTFKQIIKQEGPLTLWRGITLTLLMAIPSNIVYFTGYELLKDSHIFTVSPVFEPLICGGAARVLAGTVVAPLELLKTRLQSIPSGTGSNGLMTRLVGDLRQEFQNKGLKVLFRGLSLTLWRDVPFSGIYWSSYEYFKPLIVKILPYSGSPSSSSSDGNLFLSSFLTGSLSGTIAALFTNPFDVGKTRLQISQESASSPSTLVKPKNKTVLNFMSDIVKYEGVGALYAGLIPRILKIAPSCAVMISSYELGKRFFLGNNADNLIEGEVSEGVLE